MQYSDWLRDFAKDKTIVPSPPTACDSYAFHTITRYVDGKGLVWETGITYTERVIVRSGHSLTN